MLQRKTLCKTLMLFIIAFCSTLLHSGSFAVAAENQEIEFLLSYISASDCTFLRNGEKHTAKAASNHLRKKYNHSKSSINSPEEFITKIASQSSLSGRTYEVVCEEVKSPTRNWLKDALASQRTSNRSTQD